ncbi:MAG TPA: apolipoprotein N-acyltransferase [Sphingomonas sp.]|nr:apolipoprotein N-acyltransferase [Sphingomonas sp.]
MASLLIALALGVALAFAFQPFNLWPLALIAFGGMLLLIERAPSARRAAAIGWCFGFGQFVLGLDWIATAFTYQAKMPPWLGWVAVALLSIYLAVFPLLATLGAWFAARRLKGGAITLTFAFAACWIATEWLRGTLFTGFPWNPASVALIDLPMAKAARWTGTYALSGLMIVSVGFILMLALMKREAMSRRRLLSTSNIPAGLGLIALAALYVGPGLGQRLAPPPPPPEGHGALVRIVQPDIGQGERDTPGLEQRHLHRLQALSGAPGPEPRLILWPESAIEGDVAEDPAAARATTAMLGPKDLLAGGGYAWVRNEAGEATAARNSVFVMAPDGRILARYDKAHLVPYGEYLPMRPLLTLLGLSRLVPGDVDFLPGPGPVTVDLPGFGKVGMQLCYEMVFSGRVVDEAHRPDFIFNPSNDAWFGAAGPPQHLAQARLRAIEEGLPIARATPTGISAIIAADGRIVSQLGPHAMGMIQRHMPDPLPPTLFSRLGNWAALIVVILLGGLAFLTSRYKQVFI